MSEPKVEYVGKDLEAMDLADKYHEWIFETMRPYLGTDLVEVGAGTGGFSKLLLSTSPTSLTLVEPSQMFGALKANVSKSSHNGTVRYFNNIFSAVADRISAEKRPDSVIYVNVLEHIEDDRAELEKVFETLAPGGRFFVFVPAQPFLYSEFDKSIGHFRRYRRKELVEKCTAAGFEIKLARNFDLAGVVPWYVKYRLLGSRSMEPGIVNVYDKLVVPIAKRMEGVISPPIGKNLLVIAER